MFNLLSALVGIVAFVIALVGILPIPLVPLVNWVAFPVALVGLLLGLVARGKTGRNINIVVLLVSGLRLFLTGGLI